jgi:hypothetical protein
MINNHEGRAAGDSNDWGRPAGLSWCLVRLLRITSSIEYAMMVKYLYVAYGSENVLQSDNLKKVNVWRKLILSIAKEEMRRLPCRMCGGR